MIYLLMMMLFGVFGVKIVCVYLLFGDVFVYVLFDDCIDLYWVCLCVFEYFS